MEEAALSDAIRRPFTGRWGWAVLGACASIVAAWVLSRGDVGGPGDVLGPEAPAAVHGTEDIANDISNDTALLPPLADRSPRSAAQREAVHAAPRDPSVSTIRLTVLDAVSGEPLRDVRVQRARLDAPRAAWSTSLVVDLDADPDFDAGRDHEESDWSLTTSYLLPSAHVAARVPLVAQGASPLDVRARTGSAIYVTAGGYGHACLRVLRDAPESVTVRLPRATRLEVVVDRPADYRSLHVTLTRADGGSNYSEHRSARTGHAYFTNLRKGVYRVVAEGSRRSGETQRITQLTEVFAGERRVERIDFAARYGELSIRLSEPTDAQGGSAFSSVIVESLNEPATSDEHRRSVDEWTQVAQPTRGTMRETPSPLRVPAGRTRITVLPHGTQFEVEVAAHAVARVDEALPVLARRRIAVTDVSSGEPVGCTIRVDVFERHETGSSLSVGILESDPETGVVESWFPDTRFRLSPVETDLLFDSTRVEWRNGAAMPDELALEGRRPEPRDLDSWDSPEIQDFLRRAVRAREANVQPGR